jgi:putative ABC transport system permease protein
MQTIRQDLRYGARILLKKPGFSLIAVITLALGLGANTAMFSLIDALLFRPLPFRNMDRLAVVWGTLPQGEFERRLGTSPASYLDFCEQQHVFEQLAAYRWEEVNLTGIGEPERLHGFSVTQNLFPMLGVKLVHGRMFQPEEETSGKDDVVILSEGFWQRRFAADPGVIGQRISLNGRSHTVAGIIADGYEWPQGADLWMPMVITTEMRRDRARHSLQVAGLIKQGVTMAQAQRETEQIARRIAEQYPDTDKGRGVNLMRLPGHAADYYLRQLVALLAGGVIFVLLIACLNVANLQLVQAASRQKEIAIRSALGANRGSLIRQLLTESLMLSLVGAVLGLLIAPWVIDYAKVSLPHDIRQYLPGLRQAGIDLRTLGYTTLLGLLSGIIAGLAPAFHASKVDLIHSLKEGGRNVAGAPRHRLRGGLVVAEVALALVLLIGTGLMVRGFAHLSHEHKQGFDASQLLTMKIASLPKSKYAGHQQETEFYQNALERVAATPGVESAAIINDLPASNYWATELYDIEGRPALSISEKPAGDFAVISAGYFRNMRIPLIQGRSFSEQDKLSATPVAIISEAAVQRFFPNQDPLGHRIRVASRTVEWPWHTIVGVVGNVRQFVFDREQRATVYLPQPQLAEFKPEWMTLAVRTSADPLALVPAVREQIRGIDPDLPLYQIRTMENIITEHISPISVSATWMAGLGLLALVLAAVGVYGVMAYTVSQRRNEIGIRIALGARTIDVMRLVLGQGAKLVIAGLAIGLIAAFGLGHALAGRLYGVNATDPGTFIIVAIGLGMIGLLACWLPARRAAKVDPMVALRND